MQAQHQPACARCRSTVHGRKHCSCEQHDRQWPACAGGPWSARLVAVYQVLIISCTSVALCSKKRQHKGGMA